MRDLDEERASGVKDFDGKKRGRKRTRRTESYICRHNVIPVVGIEEYGSYVPYHKLGSMVLLSRLLFLALSDTFVIRGLTGAMSEPSEDCDVGCAGMTEELRPPRNRRRDKFLIDLYSYIG